MGEYKLELQQVVDYPRCRVYRRFIHSIIGINNLRVGRSSGLYYYTVLACHANFRTAYHRVRSVTYTVYPGEWICGFEEIMKWFRLRTKRQVISIMEKLQEKHLLKFKIVGQGDVIKYRLSGWAKYNRIPNYILHEWGNALIRCQSDRTMKNTLLSIIQKFSDVRVVQSELDASVASIKREAYMMMGLVLINVPLRYVINHDWFMTLVYSLQGKITLAVCAGIVLFSFMKIMKLAALIEYKGYGYNSRTFNHAHSSPL